VIRDGSLRWQTIVGQPVEQLFKPMRRADSIFIPANSELYELSADTGAMLTRRPLPGTIQTDPVQSGDLAIFGAVDAKVFAHNLRTGIPQWHKPLSAMVVASPVLHGDDLFVTDASGIGKMYYADSGEYRWTTRTFGRI